VLLDGKPQKNFYLISDDVGKSTNASAEFLLRRDNNSKAIKTYIVWGDTWGKENTRETNDDIGE
jgi:hypothetical protein